MGDSEKTEALDLHTGCLDAAELIGFMVVALIRGRRPMTPTQYRTVVQTGNVVLDSEQCDIVQAAQEALH